MAFRFNEVCKNVGSALFSAPEEKFERRKRRELARKKQRETDAQVAKDIRETGQCTDYIPDPFFYRHYYF